nr:helix-turn-helix domain-containing protein [uncultured Allomuricauda sp.]
MEINYNIVSIIDIFGCLQGVILGSILVYTNKRKDRSTLFLGLFVLTYAYCFIPIILNDMNILEYYPKLSVLPRPGEWLLASLFLVYIQKVSIFSSNGNRYWHIYPGLAVLLFQIVVFLLPVETKLEIVQATWYRPIFLIGLLYSTAVLVYMWRLINRHSEEVKNQFSQIEQKEFLWVKRFVFFGFILFALHFVRYFVDNSPPYRIFYAGYNVFILYWASVHGIMQQDVVSLISEDDSETYSDETKTVSLPATNEQRKLVRMVDKYLQESEVFMDKNLTIVAISEPLKVHPKRISQAINKVNGENFNSYINRYRIEKAGEMLSDRSLDNLSIEGIGTEVGFQSKSAFYTAFKKITGTTPSRYKEKLAS